MQTVLKWTASGIFENNAISLRYDKLVEKYLLKYTIEIKLKILYNVKGILRASITGVCTQIYLAC